MATEITVPQLGESVTEGTIADWSSIYLQGVLEGGFAVGFFALSLMPTPASSHSRATPTLMICCTCEELPVWKG